MLKRVFYGSQVATVFFRVIKNNKKILVDNVLINSQIWK